MTTLGVELNQSYESWWRELTAEMRARCAGVRHGEPFPGGISPAPPLGALFPSTCWEGQDPMPPAVSATLGTFLDSTRTG